MEKKDIINQRTKRLFCHNSKFEFCDECPLNHHIFCETPWQWVTEEMAIEAEKIIDEWEAAQNMKICPRCNRPLGEYPALSRRDNKTEICSDCGLAEAFEDFYGDQGNGDC